MVKYKLLFIKIVCIISCYQASNTISETERQTITQNIKSTLVDYTQAIKVEGLEAEFKYLDSSADFFWIPPGYQLPLSYDSVATILRQNAMKLLSIDNTFDSLKIYLHTKEIASYTAVIHSTIIDTAKNSFQTKMIESGTLINRKNSWKLLNGQTSIVSTK